MQDKLIIGRYLPGDSFMHRLDPRLKLIALFVFIAYVFMATNWATNLFLVVVTLGLVLTTSLSLRFFLNGLKPMGLLILFTVLIQLLFTHTGKVLWSFGILALTTGGLRAATFIFLRLVLIIFISTILTLTTRPLDLANAMESLFSFAKEKLPINELALMLSIALRFVPTLLAEADKVMDAQKARGVDFGSGSLIQRIKAMVPILIPLFVGAFDRAYELSIAMESRGYHDWRNRTKYRLLVWKKKDTLATVVLVLIGGVVIWLR